MLPALIEALIPILVNWVIALLGSPPPKQSVVQIVQDVIGLLNKFVPSWLQPEESVVESLIIAAIEKLFPNL